MKNNLASSETKRRVNIIWAVDPFDHQKTLLESAASLIQGLTQETRDEGVEPVYILNVQVPSAPFLIPPSLVTDLQVLGQKALAPVLKKIGNPHFLPLKVLHCPALTTKGRIDGLLHYAKKWGIQTLVVGTHARKGIKRWVLGSFAESLVTHSDLPVFLINPSWNHRLNFKNFLFPTDFSRQSEEAFSKVIDLAKTLKSRIIIYHKFQYELTPELGSIIEAYPTFEKAFQEERVEKLKKIQEWTTRARGQGVSAKPLFSSRLEGRQPGSDSKRAIKNENSIEDEIILYADHYNAVIAMASQSGSGSASILGSTARKVIRSSVHPVLMIHPKNRGSYKIKH